MSSSRQPAGHERVDAPTSDDATMRAVVQDRYGSSEVLRLDRIARPEIADKEVLVRVRAAGLDRGTWHVMTARPHLARLAFGLRRPKNPVPGRDVAGVVEAVGSAVTRFAVGDEVFGIAPGSFAEYAVAREDKLAPKPANVTFEQAAAVPISGLTALMAVSDVGRVERGQKVLVIGASGGVGSYAVQMATALGAEVTGVASAAKLDLVRSLGATHVIDYTSQDFAESEERYDVILDIAGNPSLSRLRRVLAPRGTAVLVGGEDGDRVTGGMGRQLRALVVSLFVRQRLAMVMPKENGADIERLGVLLTAGQITPSIERTYPLERTQEAMRHLEEGLVRGKLVITVGLSA